MNTRIAIGVFAITLIVTGTAKAQKAEILPDGEYWFSNGAYKSVMTVRKVGGNPGEDGTYELRYGTNQYYHTASSNEGEQLLRDDTKGNNWVLHKNAGGWSIHHPDNRANCISNINNALKLRRSGTGVADQLWKFEKK